MSRKSWDKKIEEYNRRKQEELREQDRNNNLKEQYPAHPDNQ